MRIESLVVLTFVVGLIWPVVSSAQTTLRWKLQPGEELAVEITQKTTSEVAYGGKKSETVINLTMHLGWEVLTAEKGKIQFKQTVTRLTIDMTAGGQLIAYDSAQTAKPAASARELAAAVSPLVGTALEITMNERGEVQEDKTANEAGEKLVVPTAATTGQSIGAKDSIQQLMRQPVVILPEKPVQAGDSWTAQTALNTSLGKAQQTTTYRYDGRIEKDGAPAEKIIASTTLSLTEPDKSRKLTIKKHEQSGTVYFDATKGRLASADKEQELVTERPYRETTIVVTLKSEQETVLRPADQP